MVELDGPLNRFRIMDNYLSLPEISANIRSQFPDFTDFEVQSLAIQTQLNQIVAFGLGAGLTGRTHLGFIYETLAPNGKIVDLLTDIKKSLAE